MWKVLPWSLMRRYIAGYGMTNARKALYTKAFDEKGRSTTSVETHMQEGDIKDLIHTLTADNGKEFAKHQEIAEKLEVSFYFCKHFHSWERGANENMNGLIRQYIPKGTDFSEITDEFLAWVENKLNNRPRKRLAYLTSNEKFNLLLTN